MGIHEWSYDNDVSHDARYKVPWADAEQALKQHQGRGRARLRPRRPRSRRPQRCLNCDVQTVFTAKPCIECDACVDICPMDCITFTANGDEADLRDAAEGAGAQPRRRTCTCRRR